MGVGTPLDLLEAVHRGVDMFDCILPTAWAQHGKAFTSHGRIDLRRGVLPRSPSSRSTLRATARRARAYSRSYLHHLDQVRASRSAGSCSRPTTSRFYLAAHARRSARTSPPTRSPRSTREHRVALALARSSTIRRRRRRARKPASRRRAARSRVHIVARRLREHPARRVRRDHALGQSARCRGRARLRRAVGRDRARRSPASGRSSCGTSGSAPRTTRWRSCARSMQRPPTRDGRARQLRARPRCAPARARAHRSSSRTCVIARRTSSSQRGHVRVATGFTWRLARGRLRSTRSRARPRPTSSSTIRSRRRSTARCGRSRRFARSTRHLDAAGRAVHVLGVDGGAIVAARGRLPRRARRRVGPEGGDDDRAERSRRRLRPARRSVACATRTLDGEVRDRHSRRAARRDRARDSIARAVRGYGATDMMYVF